MEKIINFCFIILLSFGLSSCLKTEYSSNQIKPLEETENIKFKNSWKRFDKSESLRLYDYSLKKMEEIKGIPCKGRLTLDSLGNLYGFVLGKDFKLNGTMLPAGSRYETILGRSGQKTGYMIYLSKPYDIQGYHVRDKAGMQDYNIGFYNNGSLRGFKIYENLKIDGIPCKGGKKSGISLYPNGKLWICNLSKDIEINGKRYNEGTKIIIDVNDNVHIYSLELELDIMKELKID